MSEVRAGSSEVRVTATDELRRLLDERGVPWRCYGYDDRTWWGAWYAENRPSVNDLFVKVEGVVTPAQAVEDTLGRGTCRDVRSTDHTIAFECSECGCWVAYDEYWETGIYVLHETGQEHIHPRYCPNCGRRVEQ